MSDRPNIHAFRMKLWVQQGRITRVAQMPVNELRQEDPRLSTGLGNDGEPVDLRKIIGHSVEWAEWYLWLLGYEKRYVDLNQDPGTYNGEAQLYASTHPDHPFNNGPDARTTIVGKQLEPDW